MNKKILITGGLGMIGTNLALMLLKLNYSIIIVDHTRLLIENKDSDLIIIESNRVSALLEKSKLSGSLEILDLDITTNSSLEVLKKKDISIIFHLAAKANISYSVKNPKDVLQNNYTSTLNMCELALSKNCPILFASSSSVYGHTNEAIQHEDLPLNPNNPYSTSKELNEKTVEFYSKTYGIKSIGFRFFTVYGEHSRYDMFIYSTMKKIINNNPIQLYNNGLIYRDFTYVNDICKNLIFAMNKINDEENGYFDILNIGNGKTVTVLSVVNILKDLLNKEPILEIIENKPFFDVKGTCSSVIKRESYLGMHDFISIENGLFKTVNWFNKVFNQK